MRHPLTVLLLTLVMALAACADGGSTAVGGPDATDAPIATTAPAPTDGDDGAPSDAQPADGTPVPVEGEGDIGDGSGSPAPLDAAPPFGVSSETDSDAIPPFTSCWTSPDGTGVCADGIPQPQAVTITGSDQLVITYPEGELTAGASEPFDTDADPSAPIPALSDLPVAQENPGIWLVDISGLAAGEHAVTLSWAGDQGDAFTAFTLAIAR